MFGRDGLGTGLHVDRSQAENVAFPMLFAQVWWFVHPYVAAEFGEYVKEVFGHAAGIVGFNPRLQHYSNMIGKGITIRKWMRRAQ
ncbi:hypothetical protein WJX77_006480 [Trebouxia sp. C0004]